MTGLTRQRRDKVRPANRERKRRRCVDGGLVVLAFLAAHAGPALAQSAPTTPLPGEANPQVVPGLVKPTPAPSGRNGPLAPLADSLANEGITLHALSIDFFTNNPSAGLFPGNSENSLYNIVGVDWDLSKVSGLTGTSLHYETTIFAANTNQGNTIAQGFIGQTGDTLLGYQGTYNRPNVALLSVATIRQTLLDDRLTFDIGRTNPDRFYALPLCQVLDDCFQDILYFNADFASPLYSQYGANLAYKISPRMYVEAGAFVDNGGGARIGYDLGAETENGVLGIAEIGYKTDYTMEAYPSTFTLTGFFNTSRHADLNALTPLGLPAGNLAQDGTSGVVLQASKVVWRADGGHGSAQVPTSVLLYGSFGSAIDSTTPILASMYVGATLQAPFENRPNDRFGIKFNYEKLNPSFTDYLATANLVSGGTGAPFPGNQYVFEVNAHIQLPYGLAFEPVVQYAINPNSFWNPLTPRRPQDGVFAIGTLIIPIGVLLGITPG